MDCGQTLVFDQQIDASVVDLVDDTAVEQGCEVEGDRTVSSASVVEPAPPQSEPQPSPFLLASAMPTQTGPLGIRYDFNDGCRIALPERDTPWFVRIRDLDTGNVLFQTTLARGRVNSSKRYYVRGRLEAWSAGKLAFAHDYDASGQNVLINFPVGTLGDTVGWFSYAARFQAIHQCKLTCTLAAPLIPLFRDAYPDIEIVEAKDVDAARYYATYNLGLFFDDVKCLRQPVDFRLVGLHRTAAYILGVDPKEEAPRLAIPQADIRPIAERYVCIATQSTTQAKYWNNPPGWREIIAFLRQSGYRVICVDRAPMHGHGLVWNQIPHGAEDFTGLSLSECARYLKHCEFFVGLSSGLSWLAWAAGARVIMISGFSHPTTEFETQGRVINYHACNSCWNDPALRFDHKDFLWCPRHKGTSRQFECTRLITAEQVKRAISAMPGFLQDAARPPQV